MNDGRPLYPSDGMYYDIAMMEAMQQYNAWVFSRKRANAGIQIYSRKEVVKEPKS